METNEQRMLKTIKNDLKEQTKEFNKAIFFMNCIMELSDNSLKEIIRLLEGILAERIIEKSIEE